MATVPAPRTWSGSDTPTAALLNTELRDALNFLLAVPRVVLQRAATLNISSSSTPTYITWDTEILDTANGWAATPNPTRYTVQYAGKYRISVVLSIQGSTGGGMRAAYARVNGGTRWTLASQSPINSASVDTIVTASMVLPYTFAVNDYIEIGVAQTSGSTLALSGASNNDSYATIEWMGS